MSAASSNSAPGSELVLVPRKGKTKSTVWNWFGFDVSDEAQTTPRCKICKTSVATKDSNTTNLFQHLEKKHRPQWEECTASRAAAAQEKENTRTPKKKQVSIDDSFKRAVPYGRDEPRWKRCTNAVAYYIAKDQAPLYTVEKEGFR